VPDFLKEENIKNLVKLNGYLSNRGDFFDKKLTKMMMTVKMLTIKGTVDEPYAMRREI